MARKSNLNTKVDYFKVTFGQWGTRLIGAAETGEAGEVYLAVTALLDTAITLEQPLGDTTLTLATLPAGVTIYGSFSSVSVTTGQVLAYIG